MSDKQLLQTPEASAHFFRQVLSAFSRPATPIGLTQLPEPPLSLSPATAAISLSLFDYQTPIWLSPSISSDATRKFIRLHTGSAIVTEEADAAFAILDVSELTDHLEKFNTGSHEYPDRSTTLLVQTPAFGRGLPVKVSGPGLKSPVSFAVEGMSERGWVLLQDNAALFPIGVDVLFATAKEIAAVPRSLQLKLTEAA